MKVPRRTRGKPRRAVQGWAERSKYLIQRVLICEYSIIFVITHNFVASAPLGKPHSVAMNRISGSGMI